MTHAEKREDEVERIAKGLNQLEISLLCEKLSGWGSWMFSCAAGLSEKGVMRRSEGSYYLTDLGKDVRDHLMKEAK